MTMIYLAAPYTHGDPIVREARVSAVNRVAASYAIQGILVFSPITHGHPIDRAAVRSIPYDYWMQLAEKIIPICTRVDVLMLPGWSRSSGITREIEIAENANKLVSWLSPYDRNDAKSCEALEDLIKAS